MVGRLKRGILITFEGIDGAGKSTQARRLAEALRDRGLDVVLTREPTDGPWGRLIRTAAQSNRLEPREEVEAFLEDRREHVRSLVAPALAAGRIVIIDRYYLSSVAYQGARGIDPDAIRAVNESFAPRPDRVYLVEIPVASGLGRVATRGAGSSDAFERADTLTEVARIFAAAQGPEIRRVDGARTQDEIAREILSDASELVDSLGA